MEAWLPDGGDTPPKAKDALARERFGRATAALAPRIRGWSTDLRRAAQATEPLGELVRMGLRALAVATQGLRLALVSVARRARRGADNARVRRLLREGVLLATPLALLLVALAVGVLVSGPAGRGLRTLATNFFSVPAARPGPLIALHPPSSTPPGSGLPSPAYLAGAWVSDDAPLVGGTVLVYVRVTDSVQLAPVSGALVSLQVQFTCRSPLGVVPYGPVATDAAGLAAFPVSLGGASVGEPVCVAVTARVGQQTATATTTFTPTPLVLTPTPPALMPPPVPSHTPHHPPH